MISLGLFWDKFKQRSNEPEMMDNPKVDRKLLRKNLRELDFLNRHFGGHSITLNGIKQLVDKEKIYKIVDLGCGSGDVLKYIARWARKKSIKVELTGVDLNIHSIQYMKRKSMGFPEISGVAMNYQDYLKWAPPVDIYVCSLFCHHLNNTQLVELFSCLKRAKTGFVINDLQRSPLAYYSAWIFTRILNGSVLSKNDGPASVLRAFTKKELNQLLQESGVSNYTINWKWVFRYCIIVKTN